MSESRRVRGRVLSALSFTPLLLALASQCDAANVVVTDTGPFGSGPGSLNLAAALGVAPGQAVFSSGTATFNFTAADVTNYAGTSTVYNGATTYGNYCSSCYSYTHYFYTTTNHYAGPTESATVTSGDQSASGTSPATETNLYIGQTSNTFDYYGDADIYSNYNDTIHTSGPFTASINLDAAGLSALNAGDVFNFDVTSMGPAVTFDSVSFNGNYDVVTSAVPEPGTWATMILGLFAIGVGMRARRRRGVIA